MKPKWFEIYRDFTLYRNWSMQFFVKPVWFHPKSEYAIFSP